MKPTKWGIKVWVMADAGTEYYCSLQIYIGEEGNDVEKGLASRVVNDLMEDYQGLGHQLYVDNFYTSPSYSRTLGRWNTRLGKRKGVPVAIKGDVDLNDSLFHKVNMTKG